MKKRDLIAQVCDEILAEKLDGRFPMINANFVFF